MLASTWCRIFKPACDSTWLGKAIRKQLRFSSPRRDISPPILQPPGRVTRRHKSRVGSCEAVRCMRTQARLSFDACDGGLLAGRQQLPSLYRERSEEHTSELQ